MVIKFIDTSSSNYNQEDMEHEIQVMLDIKWHNLKGFPHFIDSGHADSTKTHNVYDSKF
jgi:hypothetical protein